MILRLPLMFTILVIILTMIQLVSAQTPNNYKYYIGKWVWDDETQSWNPPNNTIQTLDLRSLQDQATRITPNGFGLFLTNSSNSLPPPYIEIPTIINNNMRQEINNRLKLNVSSQNMSSLIYDLLMKHSDVKGLSFNKMLMANSKGIIDVQVGDIRIYEVMNENNVNWNKTLSVIQDNYRTYRMLANDNNTKTPNDLHQKMLSVWMQQYNTLNYTQFIPNDLPLETPKKPSTQYTESWNVPDNTNISADLSWLEEDSYWQVINERVQVGTGGGNLRRYARAEADVSNPDHYVQIDFGQNGYWFTARVDVAGRVSTINMTTRYVVQVSNSSNDIRIGKIIDGTVTLLGTGVTGITIPGTAGLNISGSNLISYLDGTQKEVVVDVSIVTGTRGGISNFMGASGNQATYDNFLIEDYGTPQSGSNLRIVNFSDTTSNKAYYLSGSGTSVACPGTPPTVANGLSNSTIFTSSGYTNVTSADNVFADSASGSNNQDPNQRFHLKVNLTELNGNSLDWLNVKWVGKKTLTGGSEIACIFIMNWNKYAFELMATDITSTNANYSYNYTLSAGKYVNVTDGRVVFGVYGDAFDANEIVHTDYAEISYAYTPSEPGNDSCTYGGSGDWTITDNCNIGTNTDLLGNNLIFNKASGVLNVSARIFNYATVRIVQVNSIIWIPISSGGVLG